MRQEARDTLQQAREDRITVDAALAAGRHYAAVFFAQQVAEKALKALYLHRLNESPYRRNLVVLANQVAAPPAVLHACRALNPAYTTTRYVDAANGVPADMFDADAANQALCDADTVSAWVLAELERKLEYRGLVREAWEQGVRVEIGQPNPPA
jgi:HEPN domain-containing protein